VNVAADRAGYARRTLLMRGMLESIGLAWPVGLGRG
jgi:hypothetical protein